MNTLPYEGKVRIVVGGLARLVDKYGQDIVRNALHDLSMNPDNYHLSVLRDYCQQQQTPQ